MQPNSAVLNLDLDSGKHSTSTHDLVAIGGKLPYCYQVPTSKLLDVIVEVAPGCINLDANQLLPYPAPPQTPTTTHHKNKLPKL
ncbi:hypothetical protein H6F76_18375 [Leptolyngbya sp. FACHB-321]|uniref:hypothetical protein n=1 Tax=Leptolyngbya sp. FACHB-321 TaxID=2692807 RepID=UPI0016870EE4|nr:hypothetical protein [Leptolyngbya sp. FACHB-321]MBD2036976.1 hypothetical protein [Leptolyngbya sp. FACHB-321]